MRIFIFYQQMKSNSKCFIDLVQQQNMIKYDSQNVSEYLDCNYQEQNKAFGLEPVQIGEFIKAGMENIASHRIFRTENSPVSSGHKLQLRHLARYAGMATYVVFSVQFMIVVNVLNLSKKAPKDVGQDCRAGCFGNVFKQKVAAQDLRVKRQRLSKTTLEDAILEVAIMKLCSAFRIGPKAETSMEFDLICYTNSIEFLMENCETYDSKAKNDRTLAIKQISQDLQILHYLGISHNDMKTDNALWSHSYQRFVISDFGRSLFDTNLKSLKLDSMMLRHFGVQVDVHSSQKISERKNGRNQIVSSHRQDKSSLNSILHLKNKSKSQNQDKKYFQELEEKVGYGVQNQKHFHLQKFSSQVSSESISNQVFIFSQSPPSQHQINLSEEQNSNPSTEGTSHPSFSLQPIRDDVLLTYQQFCYEHMALVSTCHSITSNKFNLEKNWPSLSESQKQNISQLISKSNSLDKINKFMQEIKQMEFNDEVLTKTYLTLQGRANELTVYVPEQQKLTEQILLNYEKIFKPREEFKKTQRNLRFGQPVYYEKFVMQTITPIFQKLIHPITSKQMQNQRCKKVLETVTVSFQTKEAIMKEIQMKQDLSQYDRLFDENLFQTSKLNLLNSLRSTDSLPRRILVAGVVFQSKICKYKTKFERQDLNQEKKILQILNTQKEKHVLEIAYCCYRIVNILWHLEQFKEIQQYLQQSLSLIEKNNYILDDLSIQPLLLIFQGKYYIHESEFEKLSETILKSKNYNDLNSGGTIICMKDTESEACNEQYHGRTHNALKMAQKLAPKARLYFLEEAVMTFDRQKKPQQVYRCLKTIREICMNNKNQLGYFEEAYQRSFLRESQTRLSFSKLSESIESMSNIINQQNYHQKPFEFIEHFITLLYRKSQYQTALRIYESVKQKSPDFKCHQSVYIYLAVQNTYKAEKSLNQIPENKSFLHGCRMHILNNKGEFNQCIEYYKMLMQQKPAILRDDLVYLITIECSFALFKLNFKKQACKLAWQALKQKKQSCNTQTFRALHIILLCDVQEFAELYTWFTDYLTNEIGPPPKYTRGLIIPSLNSQPVLPYSMPISQYLEAVEIIISNVPSQKHTDKLIYKIRFLEVLEAKQQHHLKIRQLYGRFSIQSMIHAEILGEFNCAQNIFDQFQHKSKQFLQEEQDFKNQEQKKILENIELLRNFGKTKIKQISRQGNSLS